MTDKRPSALDEFLCQERHDEGCSAEHGAQYRCRCFVSERASEARAELAVLREKAERKVDVRRMFRDYFAGMPFATWEEPNANLIEHMTRALRAQGFEVSE